MRLLLYLAFLTIVILVFIYQTVRKPSKTMSVILIIVSYGLLALAGIVALLK